MGHMSHVLVVIMLMWFMAVYINTSLQVRKPRGGGGEGERRGYHNQGVVWCECVGVGYECVGCETEVMSAPCLVRHLLTRNARL